MRLKNYRDGRVQIQPRGGRSTTEYQTSLWHRLTEAGADILPITVDSNTRLEKYEEARQLHIQSMIDGIDKLNGYPFVAISNDEILEMFSKFNQPISLRHGSPIAHKLVEKALICGVDEIEGGPLTYSLPYTRATPLRDVINSWKRVEEMCAATRSRNNQPIMRESFGVLTAVLVPPYVALLTSFLEAIFAYSSGVKHFMIGLQSCGNFHQDIVQFEAARIIEKNLSEKLFPGMNIYYAYHHWMGPFPRDLKRANDVIDVCNFTAKIVQADKVVVKTNVEAHGVPSELANFSAVKRTAKLLELLDNGNFTFDVPHMEEEVFNLTTEITSSLANISEYDSISDCLMHYIESGELDLMFSPYKVIKRRMEVSRDQFGWIRISKFGNLSVTEKYKKFETRFLSLSRSKFTSNEIIEDMAWPRQQSRFIPQEIQRQLDLDGDYQHGG